MTQRSIAQQAEERGVPVPVGCTAKHIRTLGFLFDTDIPDHAVLQVDNGEEYVYLGPFKERTGYFFKYGRISGLMEEIALEEDANFRRSVLKAIKR